VCVCVCVCVAHARVHTWSSLYPFPRQYISIPTYCGACLLLGYRHILSNPLQFLCWFILHRIAYTIVMNCKGSWRTQSWRDRGNHGICQEGLGRTTTVRIACVPASIRNAIFSKSVRVTTLHDLSFSPAGIRRYIICTVGNAPLSNPRINLWEYCEVDVVGYLYRFGEQQRTKKSDSFCRVNLSGGNHIRSDVMLWPIV